MLTRRIPVASSIRVSIGGACGFWLRLWDKGLNGNRDDLFFIFATESPCGDSLVSLVCRAGGHLGYNRRALGCFLAPVHRARYVLDAGAHGDLFVRSSGGHLLRVPDSQYDLPEAAEYAGFFRRRVRLPWTARRVSCSMGWHRDAHLGSVRQLVAQCVRPRCQNCEPAA